jgi:hypothetical protein
MAGRAINNLRITALDIPIMERLLSAMRKSENSIQKLLCLAIYNLCSEGIILISYQTGLSIASFSVDFIKENGWEMMLELLENPETSPDRTTAVLDVMLKAGHATISLSEEQPKIHVLQLEAHTYARLLDLENTEYVSSVLRLLKSFEKRLLQMRVPLIDVIPQSEAAKLLEKTLMLTYDDGSKSASLKPLATTCTRLLIKLMGLTEPELVSNLLASTDLI